MSDTQPSQTIKEESVRRRYFVTLSAQFAQLAASIATAGVVPRALGPAAFGNYNFLMNTASTMRSFLDPSTSQAFFTFSSQERRSGSLTKLYAIILLAQIVIIFLAIGGFALIGAMDWLWTEQAVDQIIWVTVLEWLVFVTASLRQLGDSKGLTVHGQLITLVTAIINLVGLVGMNMLGWLNFYSYVWLNLFTALLIGIGLVYWLLIINKDLCWTGNLQDRTREYFQRWWRFASPLILLEYYKPLAAYLSIYLLQRWYGSVAQGNFALASKWSAFALVFTSSALMIFWREIANAMADGDRPRAQRVYIRFNYFLFFISIVLCSWLSFSSRDLIDLLVGSKFDQSVPVLMVMAFYPLAQTYGQLNVVTLKATERTATYRNWSIAFSVPDVFLTYFLLAPRNALVPGFELGALGVAIKMTGYALLTIQIYEWINVKYLNLKYGEIAARKIITAVLVSGFGFMINWQFSAFLRIYGISSFWALATASLVYYCTIGVMVLLFPGIAGLERNELWNAWRAIVDGWKKILSLIKSWLQLRKGDG